MEAPSRSPAEYLGNACKDRDVESRPPAEPLGNACKVSDVEAPPRSSSVVQAGGKTKPSQSNFSGTARPLCLTAHDGFNKHPSQGDEGTRRRPQALPRRSPRATAPSSVFSRCQAGSKSLPSLGKHVASPSLQPSPDSSAVSKTDPRLPCLLHSSLKPLLAGNDSKCTAGLEEGVGNLESSSDRMPTRQKTPCSHPPRAPTLPEQPPSSYWCIS